jgi:hypothetical protein
MVQAPALITGLDASAALAMPGVVDFVTAADIPGFNCTSPFGPGEELLFPAIYNASIRFVFLLFAGSCVISQRTGLWLWGCGCEVVGSRLWLWLWLWGWGCGCEAVAVGVWLWACRCGAVGVRGWVRGCGCDCEAVGVRLGCSCEAVRL